jgi:hypothetical protein
MLTAPPPCAPLDDGEVDSCWWLVEKLPFTLLLLLRLLHVPISTPCRPALRAPLLGSWLTVVPSLVDSYPCPSPLQAHLNTQIPPTSSHAPQCYSSKHPAPPPTHTRDAQYVVLGNVQAYSSLLYVGTH